MKQENIVRLCSTNESINTYTFHAKKTSAILAMKVMPEHDNTLVSTIVNSGHETDNTANEGDVIVKNLTDAGELYVVPSEKFDQRYKWVANYDQDWSVFEPLHIAQCVILTQEFMDVLDITDTIETRWGHQSVKVGDILAYSETEAYVIANEEFEQTYTRLLYSNK